MASKKWSFSKFSPLKKYDPKAVLYKSENGARRLYKINDNQQFCNFKLVFQQKRMEETRIGYPYRSIQLQGTTEQNEAHHELHLYGVKDMNRDNKVSIDYPTTTL